MEILLELSSALGNQFRVANRFLYLIVLTHNLAFNFNDAHKDQSFDQSEFQLP